MKHAGLATLIAAGGAAIVVAQSEKLDYRMLGSIRDEGLNRSQVMEHVSWLSDVYGPRLTGSPGIQQASEWAMKKFREWGLFTAHMIEPQIQPIVGVPQEWSSSHAPFDDGHL